jgi:rhodanese-related sulfurtransferase
MLRSLFGAGSAQDITVNEAHDKLNGSDGALVLDVREPDEFRSGHIKGATLIPLGDLGERLAELPKSQDIVVVCASGSRSGAATRYLVSAGYKAFNLRGGMSAWVRAGLPVTK